MSGESVDLDDLSIAVAHWHVGAWGGAEYLATKLAEALDREAVYTLGAPDPGDPNPYGDVDFEDVLSGPLDRLRRRDGRVFEYALWEDVDWREHGDQDVLVTSGSTTRAVITPDDVLHLNYCHSPPRWLYDLYHDRKGSAVGRLARPLLRHLRTRDAAVDPRVDGYLANSPIVARRIWKYYKREAEVLSPPVDLEDYRDGGDEGFYLHLGRLDEEKGVPAVVEAFAGTDRRLVLAGGAGDVGRDVRERIERAGNVEYRGFVEEAEKLALLSTCRALVFNGVHEDFGIVPVEANASGKPALVRAEGFPGLFVEDGENGYVHDGTAGAIRRAVERLEREGVADDVASAARPFSVEAFEEGLAATIEREYAALAARASRG